MHSFLGLGFLGIIVIIIVVLLWKRRTKDEIHSIDHYRNALDTLNEMRTGAGSSSVRVLDSDEARSLRQPEHREAIRSSNPRPVVGPPPGSEDGMVFDDTPHQNRLSIEGEHERGHQNPEWAISRAQSNPPFQNRQWYVMGIATAVVIVLLIIGVLIGSSQKSTPTSTTTSTTQKTTSKTTIPKTPPTTIPLTYVPQAGGSATAATYTAPSTRYILMITATGGGCWTVANSQPANTQLFAGVVPPGTPQQIPVTGAVQVTLGAPGSVSVQLNGHAVTFPTSFQAPLVLTFQPATPPTTATTTPPTTTTTQVP